MSQIEPGKFKARRDNAAHQHPAVHWFRRLPMAHRHKQLRLLIRQHVTAKNVPRYGTCISRCSEQSQ